MRFATRAAIAAAITSVSSSTSGMVDGPGAPFAAARASSLEEDPARGRLVVAGVGDVGRGTVGCARLREVSRFRASGKRSLGAMASEGEKSG